jgi:hypothetical protein
MEELDAASDETDDAKTNPRRRVMPGYRKKPTPIAWPEKEILLRLLWSKPLTHLAREFGCCHQSIHAKAKAWKIPMPGNGYWQRCNAGMQPCIPPEVAVILSAAQTESAVQ